MGALNSLLAREKADWKVHPDQVGVEAVVRIPALPNFNPLTGPLKQV